MECIIFVQNIIRVFCVVSKIYFFMGMHMLKAKKTTLPQIVFNYEATEWSQINFLRTYMIPAPI